MPTFLKTPTDWPRVVLERVDASAPAPPAKATAWDADAALADAQAKGAFDGLHRAIRHQLFHRRGDAIIDNQRITRSEQIAAHGFPHDAEPDESYFC